MGITLKNAMKLGKFSECELVTGHNGLHKEIEQVTVMEVPNTVKWLKGGELLLTSLFSIKDDMDAQRNLIPSLNNAGVTAIAIKPLSFLNCIPDNLLQQAKLLNFPVIKIPEHVSYLDISTPVMHAIFNHNVVIQEDLLRMKIKNEMEQQYKEEFIRELLFNEFLNDNVIRERGEKYQLSLSRRYVCLLLMREKNNSEFEQSMVMNKVESYTQKYFPGALVGRVRNFICMIVPLEESKESSFKHHCKRLFQDLTYFLGSGRTCIGVGRGGQDINGIRGSFLQAKQAVKLGFSKKHHSDVIFYDDLGVYRLLHQLADEKELVEFFEETVGKLVENDKNYDLNLVQTLTYYFQFNENLKRTSQEMFIHVNTLKYRINKIELLTGYSLQRSDDKMMLYLGLKIHEMLTISS
ncbi:PucR family transcriptional regulator [Bacillus massilinigeriensis]|uniref:PucR family transcriptional regulator n=1 Tax=Bacillus mediterraneensis TaxID=1805474 RepID=UPI0008F853D1|nr:PucR family transcriptional regulator [Bacillus mediterraneensis]